MTIAVCLKVQDGLVFGTDSAATLGDSGGNVSNVYENANKIINLRKGLPVGAMFWGAGGIGDSSVSTLAKDLRLKFADKNAPEYVDPDSYFIADIAKHLATFLENHYTSAYGTLTGPKPVLGVIVGGYSSQASHAECYEIGVDDQGCFSGPNVRMGTDGFGLTWAAMGQWISRLVVGFDPALLQVLTDKLGLPTDQLEQADQIIRSQTEVAFWHPAMPIQDAIDLVRFLVDLTKHAFRFAPGAPVVGGPTELACIAKHEGFKWVSRKHYYTLELNP
jgi:hypothetical protein